MSVLNFSDIENFGDLSSEYYLSEYVQKSLKIRKLKYSPLGDISYITDGEHGSPDWDKNSNIKYITAEHIKPNYIQDSTFKTISIEQDKRNARARLKENDVLIYSVGAYAGYSAKAEKHLFPANIPRSVAISRPTKVVTPEYLSVFLNSEYGEFQTKRFRAGNSQPVLALEKIKQFEIPLLKEVFQDEISLIYNKSYFLRLESKNLYTKAEEILLEEIGLKNFEPSTEPVNIKNFSESFAESGRLDAEYYQKKYDEIEQNIFQQKYFQLKDVFELKTNASPKKYTTEGVKVIKTKNIRIPSVSYGNITDYTIESPVLVQKNDLLFASMGVGSLGRISCIFDESENATIDGTIKIFRAKKLFKNKNFEIPTLLFLTSKVGQNEIYKYVIGSTGIISISKENVENLYIPKISDQKGKELTELVEESISLKKQSEHLLKVAKKSVEIAIEENEEVAMAYIKSYLNLND